MGLSGHFLPGDTCVSSLYRTSGQVGKVQQSDPSPEQEHDARHQGEEERNFCSQPTMWGFIGWAAESDRHTCQQGTPAPAMRTETEPMLSVGTK